MKVMVVGMTLLGMAVSTRVWGGDTTDRVRQELDRIAAVVKDPALRAADKEGERKARVKQLIVQWFDVQEMARRSLAAHWAKRSEQERGEFVGLFGDLFVESYTRLVVDHLADQRVVYLSEAVDGQAATIKTKFLSKRDEPTFVDFTLLRRNDTWFASDVVIDDVSIVGTYRTQFNKIIQAQSYEALLKKLRLKHEQERLGSSEKRAR
jgi:phospholipid transport system substrate-binding protein